MHRRRSPRLPLYQCSDTDTIRNIHDAYIENRTAIFRIHLAANIIDAPNRAILAHDSIFHPVNEILRAVYLLGDVPFHRFNVIRVNHSLKGAADIFIEFHVIPASENTDQGFIRIEDLLFVLDVVDQTAQVISPTSVFRLELMKRFAVTEVRISALVDFPVHVSV